MAEVPPPGRAATAPFRFSVEAWSPEYGGPLEGDDDQGRAGATIDIGVEVAESDWLPRSPTRGENRSIPGTPGGGTVVFTDGVRRVDARVWVTTAASVPVLGLCASVAAGAVACDGRARLVDARVAHVLVTSAGEAADVETIHARYAAHGVAGDAMEQLNQGIQNAMGHLEVEAARAAISATEGECPALLVADGPLRAGAHLPGTIGYVKTHHTAYLEGTPLDTVALLGDGQRTPLFLVSGHRADRFSWYLRLPGSGGGHPWSGIVRCEVEATVTVDEAALVADQVSRVLPRMASERHKDPRAPQNLYPIAGLEQRLRHLLGDPILLLRSLQRAAHTAARARSDGDGLASTRS